MLQPGCPILANQISGNSACLLRGICIDDASSSLARKIGEIGTARQIARGSQVPLPGEADTIAFICSGATKLIARASRGREQIVAFHFDGDLVSIAAPHQHGYSLKALRDCLIITFPAQALVDASHCDPRFMEALLQRTFISLHRCRDKALALGRKTAQERLASFFISMAGRIGSMRGRQCHLDLPMSRGDIADSLGLTIETVSRQFSEMRCGGLIRTDGRARVVLCDLDELTSLSGHF